MTDDSKQAGQFREVARSATLLFLPVALLTIITLYALYHIDKAASIESLINAETVVVEQQEKHFKRIFDEIITDLLVLAAHADFLAMLEEPDDQLHMHNVAKEFLSFVDHKRSYDQLRFINARGKEVIRVNLNNGKPNIVAATKLQDKRHRYYFTKAASLNKGQIYISNFDLNIENHKIETPLKPMLRVAMPVFDHSGSLSGIIILNYLGQQLLDELGEVAVNSPGQVLIVNGEGFWLKGPQASDEWGFMYPNRGDRRFQSIYPRQWELLENQASGSLQADEGLFSFRTVTLLPKNWRSSRAAHEIFVPDDRRDRNHYTWKIISRVPSDVLMADPRHMLTNLSALGTIILIIWGMYSLLSANAKVRERHAQKELQEKDRRIREIVESAFDGIITIDEHGIIGSFNPAASSIFGYRADEVIGKNISLLTPSPHKENHDDYIRSYIETGESRIINQLREVEALRKDGSLFPLSLCVSAKRFDDGRWMFTGIVRDITEQKQMEQKLEKMAVSDALTGVYNRGYFNNRLHDEFSRCKRYDTPLSLIILDIDHFKRINDSYGHQAGDAMLIAIASELQKMCRDIDILARYGGEEFVLILPQTRGKDAIILAERLRETIADVTIAADDQQISATASFGVASIPGAKADTADHYIRVADRALYQAKNSGRNRVMYGTE